MEDSIADSEEPLAAAKQDRGDQGADLKRDRDEDAEPEHSAGPAKRQKLPHSTGAPAHPDSEATEAESDEDSAKCGDDFDFHSLPATGRHPTPDALSEEAVCERRMSALNDLRRIYKVEYWGLMEELRLAYVKHEQSKARASGGSNQGTQQARGSRRAMPATSLRSKFRSRTDGTNAKESQAIDSGEDAAEDGCEIRGYGSDAEPATFSDVEAEVCDSGEQGSAYPSQTLRSWKSQYRGRLKDVARLEQAASACSARELDRLGALACFCGRSTRFLVKHTCMSIGRATDTSQVDFDLSKEGDARKISRNQAYLSLGPDANFQLKNIGRRTMFVNNCEVEQGQVAQLGHLSLIEIDFMRLLFMVNHAAVARVASRTAQLRA